MAAPSRPEIVRRMFAAYMARDRQAVEALLAEDFSFTSPYDDAIEKAAYFERCWPTGASDYIRSNVLERIFEQGDEAFVLYRCSTTDGKEFRNVEHFTFDGDRIESISVYFGASYRNGVFEPLRPT